MSWLLLSGATLTDSQARTIWVVRHAERLDFVDKQWAAAAPRSHDPPLSALGARQARALARRLSPESIHEVFSSPFLRCVETATAIAAEHKKRVKVDVGLSEWLNSDWFDRCPTLLSRHDLAALYGCIDTQYRARGYARYGESGEEALMRSANTGRRLAAEFDGNLILVGHGASVLGAMRGLMGWSETKGGLPDMAYCSLSKLSWQPDHTWHLEFLGDVSHLDTVGGEVFDS